MKLRLAFLAALALFSTQAHAQFTVEEAGTTENRVVVSVDNAVFLGEVAAGGPRNAHSASVDWGIIHGWTTGLGVQFQNNRGASVEFDSIEWNNTFAIFGEESVVGWTRGDGYGDTNISLYASFRSESGANNDVGLLVGPVLDWSFGGIDYGVNFLFDVPLDGGDTDFVYAASAMLALTPTFSAGLEAHSEVVRIFDSSPDFEDQTHFIGPALATHFAVGAGQTLQVTAGGLIGLTPASPDFVATLNVSLDLY